MRLFSNLAKEKINSYPGDYSVLSQVKPNDTMGDMRVSHDYIFKHYV